MVSKIKNKNEILQLNYIHQMTPKLNITRNNKGEKCQWRAMAELVLKMDFYNRL